MKNHAPSSNTRHAKLSETIAKVLIWCSAGITIFILVWIIGYIIYKGMVSDIRTEYNVVGKGNTVVPLDEEGNTEVVFIVHKDIRAHDLSIHTIHSFFNGDERFWLVTEQGLKVRPFAPDPGIPLGQKVKDTLLMSSEEYASSVVFAENDEEIIHLVARTKGGIGIIHPESMDNPRMKTIKTVPVRFLSIVANKNAGKIQNNRRLTYLTEKQVREIFLSKVRNWKEVGGILLPLTVISYNENTYLGTHFKNLVLEHKSPGPKGVFFNSFKDILTTVQRNDGAVCYCHYLDARKHTPDQIIKVERRIIKPNLTLHFLIEEPQKAGKAGGISSIIINTLLMIILTLAISTPIGVGAAIYLTEYAKQGKLISILRFFTETLAAIPSIIFGLFGYILFVNYFKWGMGLLSGTLTITIMILPTIIRTSEEAFKAVPKGYREDSLALGATLWQTIKGVVIPTAIPGILTGVILAIGRAVGETAAVLFTLGSSPAMAKDIFSSARVLSLHLYILAKEGISFERAFATAFILVIIILIVNTSTTTLIGKMNKLGRKNT